MLALAAFLSANAQPKPAVESFEKEAVLQYYRPSGQSELAISPERYKFGQSSLKWQWKGKSHFSTSHFRVLSQKESPLAYGDHFQASPTFIFSIYNEKSSNDTLRINFSKSDEDKVWFDLALTFTGWRTLWVPFYEMQGNPPEQGAAVAYDAMQCTILTTGAGGVLYFDDVVFSQYQDDRHQYPDMHVPFIKKEQGLEDDHWMPQLAYLYRIQQLKPVNVSKEALSALDEIEQRLEGELTLQPQYKVYIDDLKSRFDALKIISKEGKVFGPPLTFQLSQIYYDENIQGEKRHNAIEDFGKVMKRLAQYYYRAIGENQKAIEEMFEVGVRYYLDQGWQEGASGGTRHHIGYNTRELAEAFFIMRKPMASMGLLSEAGGSLLWLFNVGKLLGDDEEFFANIDYLNTQAFYHLLLIFLADKKATQHQLMQAYSHYISVVLAQDDARGVFKADGTGWHHNGHYPAYAFGAFRKVPKILKTLAGTPYRISQQGHANFKKAIMATRLYSQGCDVGFGNSGRHPLGESIRSLQQPYLELAQAGNPENTSAVDTEVAAAYLRLWGDQDKVNATIFSQLQGIQKESVKGYYTFPYAATAVHHRDRWAAIVKGYSRYVWASEIYVTDNRYGRYQSNGTIQLLNEKGNEGSGFHYEGWDWNRYPGATVVYLPFETLEPDMPLIMFRSQETFAGAAQLGSNGVFGMILNEEKGSNADGPETAVGFSGKLKARKSVFSFGDKLICIGTGISSVDDKHPVHTNLFQTGLTKANASLHTAGGKQSKFPVSQQQMSDGWIVDQYGTGYHVVSPSPVYWQKQKQLSYHDKYSVNTGKLGAKAKGVKETEGDFATAWIDHGVAPKGANYHYVIYPFLTDEGIKNFGKTIKKGPAYKVLQADNQAHIIHDDESRTTSYVLFETGEVTTEGVLKHVSAPCLAMINKEGDRSIKMSVVQPDLNFPEDQRNYKNYSEPVGLTMLLNGYWKVNENLEAVKDVAHSEGLTKIDVQLQHGLALTLIESMVSE
ncbi:MAG: chondroitinase family polysaccharide lyase [Cyclobacteriaceae bacterium]